MQCHLKSDCCSRLYAWLKVYKSKCRGAYQQRHPGGQSRMVLWTTLANSLLIYTLRLDRTIEPSPSFRYLLFFFPQHHKTRPLPPTAVTVGAPRSARPAFHEAFAMTRARELAFPHRRSPGSAPPQPRTCRAARLDRSISFCTCGHRGSRADRCQRSSTPHRAPRPLRLPLAANATAARPASAPARSRVVALTGRF